MQDVIEKDEEAALMKQYTRPKGAQGRGNQQQSDQGFMVRGGPWSAATEDFPSLGEGAATGIPPKKMQWGPSMLGPKLPGTK
jgi:hypothetical protein